ncbi:hypothetical protein OAF54_00740 [bacterium]|nr:hypothetical protein [bacterium]
MITEREEFETWYAEQSVLEHNVIFTFGAAIALAVVLGLIL